MKITDTEIIISRAEKKYIKFSLVGNNLYKTEIEKNEEKYNIYVTKEQIVKLTEIKNEFRLFIRELKRKKSPTQSLFLPYIDIPATKERYNLGSILFPGVTRS
jgi:hypothetical protein